MNDHDISLGRLEKVPLRNVWANEADNFTPWLALEKNIALLGDAIGMDLEVEAQEKEVGPFRADILCKDTANDSWVLIENQLERTDHTHLGQLMTYAAGLQTVTIVWIASRFTDEHRAAMDWLNSITGEEFNFFALEVELWRIGESDIAPKFNIVCKPNDWSRSVSQGARQVRGELTGAKQTHLEFWTAFCDFVAERETTIKTRKPYPYHWMNMSIGRSGFHLTAVASHWDSQAQSYDSHELRAEMEMYNKDAKIYFAQLEERKEAIERELGEPLSWHNPADKKASRVYLRTGADLNDRQRWPEYFQWLLTKLEKLQQVLFPHIKQLDSASPENAEFEG